MSRPQPRSHCRELYASSAPYQIPMPRSCTTRNTSWSSSPSRSSIPLTPRSICTMCCLYTLFLVGLVCACGAVFYLVEEFLIKDDTATSDVISTTPVDVTIDSTTDCKTTKVPVKPTVKTTPATTTTKAPTTTKTPTTTTDPVEDSSSCSDSSSTTESTSKYRISTNASSSETTTHPHPPLNESNYVSGNSTTADCVTPPTEDCTNDTDDSITTASSSSGSKTQVPAKPSSQDKDESTSTDCSSSVEDTAVVNSLVVGENKKEESRGSERKNFL